MLRQMGITAKAASYEPALLSDREKNRVLETVADKLEVQMGGILSTNIQDVEQARTNGLGEAMLDRLALTPARLKAITDNMRQICNLADPVGQVIDSGLLDSGLCLEHRRIPLGMTGAIYGARPDITVDVTSLYLRTSNAAILHGGKETYRTSATTMAVIQKALEACGLPTATVQSIDGPDRTLVVETLRMDKYIDMLIPRDGAGLYKLCRGQSAIPIITGGIGVCHIYVDDTTEIAPALKTIVNAKTQRPSTHDIVETLLVYQDITERFLSVLSQKMADSGVTLHGDEAVIQVLHGPAKLVSLEPEELDNEFLSLDLNVVVVENMDGTITHICEHGIQHSGAILTCTLGSANHFVNGVDSSAMYISASTRFTDGGQFGLDAEVAVNMQKLYAHGPMGPEALTTYEWIDFGNDMVRV